MFFRIKIKNNIFGTQKKNILESNDTIWGRLYDLGSNDFFGVEKKTYSRY